MKQMFCLNRDILWDGVVGASIVYIMRAVCYDCVAVSSKVEIIFSYAEYEYPRNDELYWFAP